MTCWGSRLPAVKNISSTRPPRSFRRETAKATKELGMGVGRRTSVAYDRGHRRQVTNAMPAQPITADVTGAQVVRLVVTDGGDGIDSDHADWADAKLSC